MMRRPLPSSPDAGSDVASQRRGAQVGNRNAKKHGLYSLARRLKNAGLTKVDGRSALERVKADWKAEIRAALGGDLPPQKEALLETAANTWLMLASVDDWLLDQKSLVVKRRRELIAVVQQRPALVRNLRELLSDVGLNRVAKPVPTLRDWIEGNGHDDVDDPPAETRNDPPNAEPLRCGSCGHRFTGTAESRCPSCNGANFAPDTEATR